METQRTHRQQTSHTPRTSHNTHNTHGTGSPNNGNGTGSPAIKYTTTLLNIADEHKLKLQWKDNLLIVKHTRETDGDSPVARNFKGLILKKDPQYGFEILAPAVKIPQRTVLTNGDPVDPKTLSISAIYMAQDAIQYRVFHDHKKWRIATNGSIDGEARFNSSRSFKELFDDTKFDYRGLNTDWCYFFLLEHPDHQNIIKHKEISLTLFRIVDRVTGKELDDLECHDRDRDSEYECDCERECKCEYQVIKSLGVDPSIISHDEQSCDVGFLVKTTDGELYRFENPLFKKKRELRGNTQYPLMRWIDQRSYQEEYLALFPEDRQQWEIYDAHFKHTLTRFQNEFYRRFHRKEYVEHLPQHKRLFHQLHEKYGKWVKTSEIELFLNGLPTVRLFDILKYNP